MRNFWMMIFAGVMLLAAPSVGTARAQSGGVVGARGQNAMIARQQAKSSEAVEAERRKQLGDETAKLLQLATELKAAVDRSNKNELSLEVIRKADDVEKLAHDLKQKMRS
jgi:hypothetical protein